MENDGRTKKLAYKKIYFEKGYKIFVNGKFKEQHEIWYMVKNILKF